MSTKQDIVQVLRDDFRHRLGLFYHHLNLAQPYDTVEKAMARLTSQLSSLPAEERAQISSDPHRRWAVYRQVFTEAGLPRKHRGIIAGLIRSEQIPDSLKEYEPWLDTFLEASR